MEMGEVSSAVARGGLMTTLPRRLVFRLANGTGFLSFFLKKNHTSSRRVRWKMEMVNSQHSASLAPQGRNGTG